MEKINVFEFFERKIKPNGVIVEKYKPYPDIKIYIDAIDPNTGEIQEKEILEYSIHKNIVMYKIEDSKSRFKTFWSSEDHSLLVYNNLSKTIEKISPKEILTCNYKDQLYFIIKNKDKKDQAKDKDITSKLLKSCLLIPVTEISITRDYDKNTGYDFTVKDYYTFALNDGLFVQDSMACYVPLTRETKDETRDVLWSYNQLLSPADGEIIFTPNQDVILGVYQITRDDLNFEEHTKKVTFKGKKITLGRKLFNELLPADYPLIDKTIDKGVLMEILSDISVKYDRMKVGEIYDNIKKLGFKYSTLYPISLSLKGFDLGYDWEWKAENIFTDIKDRYGNYNREEKEIDNLKQKFPFKDMIDSGARGNWTQVKQMVLSRGYLSDVTGKITDIPIISSNFEGLTEQEYFLSCYGTRKGLIDTAENTAKSGYLTRTLVYAGSGCELDDRVDDCGSERYLEVEVDDIQTLKSLAGQYHLIDGKLQCISKDDKHLIGKIVLLRSPIFCLNKTGICKTCYGEHRNIVNSKYIGIVAAQSLGEVATQLVLRTFHLCIRGKTKLSIIGKGLVEAKDVYEQVNNTDSCFTYAKSTESSRIEITKIKFAYKDRLVHEFIRVHMSNGNYLDCTEDHKWLLESGEYKEAKDLQAGDRLCAAPDFATGKIPECKVIKTEYIKLDEPEYFYDFTVDSEFHNFVAEGVFIHNSGSALLKEDSDSQEDIISDIKKVNRIFSGDINISNISQSIVELYNIYKQHKNLKFIHFQVLISQLLWYQKDKNIFTKYRLVKDPKKENVKIISVKQVPIYEHWLLGCLYGNLSNNLVRGLIEKKKQDNILVKLALGKF